MTYLSKNAAIIKIKLLQNSKASSYFETHERLFLKNMLYSLEHSSESSVKSDLAEKISKLYQKYQKYL